MTTFLRRQLLVLESAGFVVGNAQSLTALGFVVLVVAFAPVNVSVAFKIEDVSRVPINGWIEHWQPISVADGSANQES